MIALKNVVEAHKSLIDSPAEMHSGWERSYQRLAQGEASGLQVISLLNDLGLNLSVAVKDEQSIDVLVNHSY